MSPEEILVVAARDARAKGLQHLVPLLRRVDVFEHLVALVGHLHQVLAPDAHLRFLGDPEYRIEAVHDRGGEGQEPGLHGRHHAVPDFAHARRLGDQVLVKHDAEVARRLLHVLHRRAVALQKRNEPRRVVRQRLHVEGHLGLADVRGFERADIELQRVRGREAAELVSRHAHLRADVLEEVLHRASAVLQEIADLVVHILENVG